jgi:hypothetical protein
MTEALARYEAPQNAVTVNYRTATDVAGVCKAIVVQTAVNIQGRKYVRVEGWQAIAVAHGCIAGARDVERITGGVRAIGEVRRGTDGVVLASAEGFVGDDEDTWGKRAEYAKRAMAQTRAISRACRSAFAHVVVMMNAGLETTPAEEVPAGGFDNRPTPPPTPPPPPAPQPAPATPAPPKPDGDTGRMTAKVHLGEVKRKEWRSAKGPWTRFYTQASDGEYYSTFDRTTGEQMDNLAGEEVVITYREAKTAKGTLRDVLEVIPLMADEETPRAEDPDEGRKDAHEMPF